MGMHTFSPAASTAQLQTAHSSLVGYSPGIGDPCNRGRKRSTFRLQNSVAVSVLIKVVVGLCIICFLIYRPDRKNRSSVTFTQDGGGAASTEKLIIFWKGALPCGYLKYMLKMRPEQPLAHEVVKKYLDILWLSKLQVGKRSESEIHLILKKNKKPDTYIFQPW